MPRLTLLCGPAGAGKTTHARALEGQGFVRLSMDEAVWADGWRVQQPPQQRLQELYDGLKQTAVDLIADGDDVVVDLSSATRSVRDEWRALADSAGATFHLRVLSAPYEVLWRRLHRRNELVGPNAVRLTEPQLRAYLDSFEWPSEDEGAQVVDG